MAELVAPGLKLPEVGKPPETLGPDKTNVAWKGAYTVLFPGVEAVAAKGQPQIAQRLADGQKAAAAISQASKAEAKYNPASGKYLTPDAADSTKMTEADLADSLPDIIAGLEEVVALNQDIIIPASSDTSQQTITVQQAKDALKKLTELVRVEVLSTEDKQLHQITYDHYSIAIEQLAMKTNNLTPEQWKVLTPAERETHIYNTRKTVGGKYSLEFEKPPLDLEARVNNAINAATYLEQNLFRDESAKKSVPVSLLVYWREHLEEANTALAQGKGSKIDRDSLAALVSESAEAVLIEHPTALSPQSAEGLGLAANLSHYQNAENIPITTYLKEQFISMGMSTQNVAVLFSGEVNIAKLTGLITKLAKDVRKNPQAVLNALQAVTGTDQLSGAESYILQTLIHSGDLFQTAAQGLAGRLGLDLNKPFDPRDYLKSHLDLIMQHAGFDSRDPNYGNYKKNALEYFKFTNEDMIKIAKQKGKGLYAFLLLFLIIPQIQGLLNTGLETERQQG